ncbi:hypothetical protein B0T25DRAFT_333449 [Lasiosphaeria hispida]|uniref:Uncharacterized protein n=1 Tax=Lasiosphaeria hispida TaxID=260671 RepID=A0AAJ0H5T6_9PEZI|nr:hypothetical protein B0T25DRAFT_333449 [Lasiosphaeria hispida]
MENEPPTIPVHEDGWTSKRGRIIGNVGKLFGRDRDRKVSHGETPDSEDLNEFLRGPSDTLQVAHAAPPMLAKLDIKSATRYPHSLDVNRPGPGPGPDPGSLQHDLAFRPRSRPPRNPLRKGLVVRFVDTYPDVIGAGGDECEVPTAEISKSRRPRPSAVAAITAPARLVDTGNISFRALADAQASSGPIFPKALRRTHTGNSINSDAPEPELPAGMNTFARHLDGPLLSHDDKRRSFIEVHQAEMREAEGLAFANAVRSGAENPQPGWNQDSDAVTGGVLTESPTSIHASQLHPLPQSLAPDAGPHPISPQPPFPQPGPAVQAPRVLQIAAKDPSQNSQYTPGHHSPQELQYQLHNQMLQAQENQMHGSPEQIRKFPVLDRSPSSTHSTTSGSNHPYQVTRQGSRASERDTASMPSPRKPSSNLHDVVLAVEDDALDAFVARTRHLFELFRLHSESVQPLVDCTPRELTRAGLWWFLTGRIALENTIRERPATPEHQQKTELARQQAYADLAKAYWLTEEIIPNLTGIRRAVSDPDVEDALATLASSIRKLAVSMKRNNFLPPEEAFLPQTIDRSIWVDYPQLTQDIVSLLWGSPSSALAHPKPVISGMSLLEALPLNDSPSAFCFGRFHAEVFLMEQGRESQNLYFSCFLSITRPQKQPDIIFVIASQDGSVQLRISGNKNVGPAWEDVRWRSDNCTLEIRLPRGFILAVQCSLPNYKMLWNMYDFSAKVHSSLYPRQDENCIFRSTLRAFQYFDNDPQSRQFPKDSTPSCDVALFERVEREGAAAGPRTYHRGYRIAVVTGTKVKTLSGVNQVFSPQSPVQYGFLRSDVNDPALSLKFENGKLKGNMVLSFGDEQERLRMHSLLIGTALSRDENVLCEVPVQGVWFSERYGDTYQKGLQVVSALPWQRVRVINHDNNGDRPLCVLADRLRVVYEFKDGTFTDRINVAPGELRIRLDAHNPSCMMLFRQPQADITIAVTEAKVPRELPPGLSQGLETLHQSPTIRTLMFPSVGDLHTFQTAITGYRVRFDGIASAFAIARRRMVVPIHKKWEAGATRVQVVQQDGATQFLAFFDDFAHGQCVGFQLKGTDVFESFSRSSKAGLRIVDAKFPLPKLLSPGLDGAQPAADAAFVCLDLPELPGEHDDISVLFDSEIERDRIASCLPAPVKGSRLPRIKGLN